MSTFIDVVMLALFLLFMIFIFGGYHKNKSAQREAQREADEKKLKDKESF
jgi:Ca2+/Na+ antiporter